MLTSVQISAPADVDAVRDLREFMVRLPGRIEALSIQCASNFKGLLNIQREYANA